MKFSETIAREARDYARRKKPSENQQSEFLFDHNVDVPLTNTAYYRKPGKQGFEFTTFNIIVILVFAGLIATAYISNVVAVDDLMIQRTNLRETEQKLLQQRENLRADINMLTSYNRIHSIALEKLGLVDATERPYVFSKPEGD
ncbi:MAG: hypothetical protein CL946_09335 [Ectothiorhodospiraceae bacterium]|nr:hypothetical protein [Ectothiorhodospiraceae bacterium]